MPRDLWTLAKTQDALSSLITGCKMGHDLADPDAFVVGDARANAAERVAVYAFMYRARLVEAMESHFPRLAKQVGEAAFADLVSEYVEMHPSMHPSLRLLGAAFADWLVRRHAGLGLADLAKLEWARADIFDAEDEPVLDVETIRTWPQARFAELPIKLIGAQRQLVLARGTVAAWLRSEEWADDEAVESDAAARTSSAESVLVWRQGVVVFHRTVGEAECDALALAATGTTLGRICACAGEQPDITLEEAISQAFTWLWSWASDQLLTAPQRHPTRDSFSVGPGQCG
jgi:hypothetical protein